MDTNPPVFVWKPGPRQKRFRLIVAHDEAFRETCLDVADLTTPFFLPEKALPAGRYWWKWAVGQAEAEPIAFEIPPEAPAVEVPPIEEWIRRFASGHPRIYVRPEQVEALRASREAARAQRWQELHGLAERVLAEPHELAEPPFLPDWAQDYNAAYAVWYKILFDSRRFMQGAQTLALAYLASGDARYGRAACRRIASVCRWDPEGSSHIAHNDEAHMSIVWWGPAACDWAWDLFTDAERSLVVEHFRRRGQITYDHLRNRGCYGVTRFDSHSGREIVFLAMLSLVFLEDIPEARTWLEWLRPVLGGIWPIWGTPDGGWAEGISYGLAYVGIMTMFATALKQGAGVDLYRRPFWRHHPLWRQWCHPPYAQWIGFGDHSERWAATWNATADLVELISRHTADGATAPYVAAMRREAALGPATPPERGETDMTVRAQLYLLDAPAGPQTQHAPSGVLKAFPGVGWAAFRTDLADASRDVALIFRSSPFGSVSHSHANNNDFILHVAGQIMLMPSGYYDGYGSAHHMGWVWHTKSHNCVTLSDAGQLMQSHDSAGAIENVFEDEHLAYLRANADASYRLHAARCRRHVIWLKKHGRLLLLDEFVAAPRVRSALQWNVHSWARFAVDEDQRTFEVRRGESHVKGHVLWHRSGFFSTSEGWNPPPMAKKNTSQWHMQYHLRFTPHGHPAGCNLGVLLCPAHPGRPSAPVEVEPSGDAEVARVGEDLVVVSRAGNIAHEGLTCEGPALLRVEGRWYGITDGGVRQL